jgi:DNA invertase Pin-like site-specific DNA recombinase
LPNELKHIIKSIAKFCKSSRFGAYSAKFKEKQREDGRIGGKASNSSNGGKARSEKYAEKRVIACEMRKQGASYNEIASKLCISKRTAINWLA